MPLIKYLNTAFTSEMGLYWMNLSRFTGVLIILNISLFFVTELVTTQGYYYTFYSLLCLGIVEFGLLVPLGLMKKFWYYCIYLAFEVTAVYFLVSSVWYWVKMNKG